MNRIYRTLLALSALGAGCFHIVRGPTQAEFAAADFGAPPADPNPAVSAFLEDHLRDPSAAKVEVQPPEKDFWGRVGTPFVDRELHYGWCSIVKVDPTNAFGSYTGWEDYRFCFRDGALAHVDQPTRTDPLEPLCRQCVPQTYNPQ